MSIDLPTLMMAGSFVAAVSGVFLIFAWMQTDNAYGVLWWAAADLVLAVAIPMITTDAPPGSPPMVVGITLLNLSPALIWASARAVSRKRIDLTFVGAGAVFWLLAFAMPPVRQSPQTQVALNMAVMSVFLYAAAYEFWRSRNDRLTARWPLIVLLVLHGTFSILASIDQFVGIVHVNAVAVLQSWYGFLHLETLAFVVGTSIFTAAMARERNELAHKTAANTDALTGVATRRRFYDKGEELVSESLEGDAPLAIILFDLDGFKAINDTFGHGPGDEVLRLFGESVRGTLRSSDLIGRLGGEEFGALLPGATIGAAYVAAERIRAAFTKACRQVGDGKITATVSAGIAEAHAGSTLDSLVQTADLALYRAKMQGRDRVEVAETEEHVHTPAPVSLAAAKRVA